MAEGYLYGGEGAEQMALVVINFPFLASSLYPVKNKSILHPPKEELACYCHVQRLKEEIFRRLDRTRRKGQKRSEFSLDSR
jgi:hypothetical protein